MRNLIRRAAVAAGTAVMAAVPLTGIASGTPAAQALAVHMPAAHKSADHKRVPAARKPSPDVFVPGGVDYQGGPVQHDPTFYAVYWLPSGDNFEPGVIDGNTQYEARINQFLRDMSQTNIANVVAQYYDASGSVGTQSKFGGYWVDTSSYPNSKGTTSNPLLDSDIQAEVQNALANNPGWQQNLNTTDSLNTTVIVFTAAGVEMCFHDRSTNGCTPAVNDPGGGSCGGHYYLNNSVAYAALPEDETMPVSSSLGGCGGSSALPQGDIYSDTEIYALAHELVEAETDPSGGSWINYGGGSTGAEIADKCLNDFGYRPWFGGSGYNVAGRLYVMQQVWSNISNSCEGSTAHGGYTQVYGPFAATAGQSTGTLLLGITNNPPNLPGAPSPTMDWGDGTSSQVSIGSCTIFNCQLQASHTYAYPGDYQGTLTYYDGFAIALSVQIWFRVFGPLTIQANNKTMTYGGQVPTFDATFIGLKPGDTPGVVQGLVCGAADNGGNSIQVTSTTPPGTYQTVCRSGFAPDYAISYLPGTLTINPAPLTITANDQTTTYGAAASFGKTANSMTFSGLVNGDSPSALGKFLTITSNVTATSGTGTYQLTPSGAQNPNYAITYQPGTLTVNPAPLTITANDQATTYGAAASFDTSANSMTFAGFVDGDSPSALGSGLTITSNVTATSGTGTYQLTPGGAQDPNYAITYGPGTLTVGPVALTATADNVSRLFGAPNPPLTVTMTGFVNGDTQGVVSGSAACGTTAQPSSPGGSYPVSCTQGTLSATNYVFTFDPGTLTVGYTGGSCMTGTHTGGLTIQAGQAVCFGAGFTPTGPVLVQAGGALDMEGAKLSAKMSASGAAQLRMCGTSLTGPLTVSGSTGLLVIGDDEGPACAGNVITGPVYMSANSGGAEFDNNTVNGPLTIIGTTGTVPPPDTGSLRYTGNVVTGKVHIS